MNPLNVTSEHIVSSSLVCASPSRGWRSRLLGGVLGLTLLSACAEAVPTGYTLVWSDEFSGAGLPDPTHWAYDTERNALGWYNDELQYYSAGRLDNTRLSEGKLIITARREALRSAADYGGQNYTSSRLFTLGKASWTYGFFEVRAKLPCGGGTWPAIWMLGQTGEWPLAGEIDIMEQIGNAPSEVLGTIHTGATAGTSGNGSSVNLSDVCSAFHRYQLTWTPQKLVIGVDDKAFHTFVNDGKGLKSWPFDHPQYLLLNLAIGGSFGGKVDDRIFPVNLEVDYVRVYQKR